MYWANFLHIYQPHDQHKDIVDAVVAQSYRPVLQAIRDRKKVRLTMNINASLLELFDKFGHHDLIEILRDAALSGQIELTGSAKYHTFLPFLDEAEIERQIKINEETCRKYLGDAWKPRGFFPPEMAFDPKIIPIIERLGYEWIILDEIACGGAPGNVDYTKVYRITGSKLKVFFRERRLSNLIMGAVVRSAESLKEAMKDDLASKRYVITAMDGETFGHHRPGLEKMLFQIFDDTDFDLIKISEISDHFTDEKEISPVNSTWASSADDIASGNQFLSWSDPASELHKMQKEFTDMVLAEVNRLSAVDPHYHEIRARMDSALASDQYFWSSAKPWWSIEMIEAAAFNLLEIIRMIPNASTVNVDRARSYYESIVSTAFNWQRSGKVRQMSQSQYTLQRIPFKDRTLGKGGSEEGIYYAFIDMMKDLEKKAAEKGEYEKALLWRDAVYKLENRLDIYDAINAIDLLRIEIPHEQVEQTLDKYTAKYKEIRGGQPEQRGS